MFQGCLFDCYVGFFVCVFCCCWVFWGVFFGGVVVFWGGFVVVWLVGLIVKLPFHLR